MRLRIMLLFFLIVAFALACGPSLRRTYQSDNAFARCFDMDYNPGAKKNHKKKCWTTWLEKYVYNQPTDKIAYAELRLEELAKGVSIPGPPGPPGKFDKRPAPQEAPETDPMPEPPDQPQPPAATPDPEKTEIDPAVKACEGECKNNHTACMESCGVDGGPMEDCPPKCIEDYTACIKNCLKEEDPDSEPEESEPEESEPEETHGDQK